MDERTANPTVSSSRTSLGGSLSRMDSVPSLFLGFGCVFLPLPLISFQRINNVQRKESADIYANDIKDVLAQFGVVWGAAFEEPLKVV